MPHAELRSHALAALHGRAYRVLTREALHAAIAERAAYADRPAIDGAIAALVAEGVLLQTRERYVLSRRGMALVAERPEAPQAAEPARPASPPPTPPASPVVPFMLPTGGLVRRSALDNAIQALDRR